MFGCILKKVSKILVHYLTASLPDSKIKFGIIASDLLLYFSQLPSLAPVIFHMCAACFICLASDKIKKMSRIFTEVFVRKSKKTIDIAEVSGGEGRRERVSESVSDLKRCLKIQINYFTLLRSKIICI